MAPHVNVDSTEITARTRRELLRLLESIRGKKNLVIQKTLLGPLGLITKFSTLQEYGVEKLFVLENRNVETTEKNIVFFSRGEKPKEVQAVAESIKQIRRDSQDAHDFSIIWAPRRTLISDRILEENGVLGEANILSCPLYFTSLAPDLVSLELDEATSDLYLRHDPTCVFLSAKALMDIQQRSGLIPRILGKGDSARRLVELLLRLRAEGDITSSASSAAHHLTSFGTLPSNAIDSLIVIDREVDLPTPLLTQLTYAGLLDESFGIQYNTLEAPTSVVGAAQASSQSQANPAAATAAQKRKIQLDQSDALYPSLQDINFALLGPTLNARARALMTNYEARHKHDASISDLKSFVQKLPSYQAEQASLKIHTGLAEEILRATRSDVFSTALEIQQTFIASGDSNASAMLDKVEDLIARAVPLSIVLRLLCLASTVLGGLRAREMERFRTLIAQGYGYQHLLTLSRLESMGLLTQRQGLNTAYLNPMAAAGRGGDANTNDSSGSSPSPGAPSRRQTDYGHVRRALRLLVDDVDEAAQQDTSYVFSGYAPLSVRIVQCALQKSWPHDADAPSRPAAAAAAPPPTTTASPAPPAATPTTPAPPATHVTAQVGWKGFEDALARVRGATVDVSQVAADEGATAARAFLKGSAATSAANASRSASLSAGVREGPTPFLDYGSGSNSNNNTPTVTPAGWGGGVEQRTVTSIVFFLGGITWAEVAALRLVGKRMREARGGENRRLLIATTGVINGNGLVGGAIEPLTFG